MVPQFQYLSLNDALSRISGKFSAASLEAVRFGRAEQRYLIDKSIASSISQVSVCRINFVDSHSFADEAAFFVFCFADIFTA